MMIRAAIVAAVLLFSPSTQAGKPDSVPVYGAGVIACALLIEIQHKPDSHSMAIKTAAADWATGYITAWNASIAVELKEEPWLKIGVFTSTHILNYIYPACERAPAGASLYDVMREVFFAAKRRQSNPR